MASTLLPAFDGLELKLKKCLAPPNGMPPQVQQAPPPPPQRPHQEIQSRTTGPFVTHPPKPTRVLHSEVSLDFFVKNPCDKY